MHAEYESNGSCLLLVLSNPSGTVYLLTFDMHVQGLQKSLIGLFSSDLTQIYLLFDTVKVPKFIELLSTKTPKKVQFLDIWGGIPLINFFIFYNNQTP